MKRKHPVSLVERTRRFFETPAVQEMSIDVEMIYAVIALAMLFAIFGIVVWGCYLPGAVASVPPSVPPPRGLSHLTLPSVLQ